MGLYEVPLSMSLLGFGMGSILTNFHMCDIMLLLRAFLNMLVRNVLVYWCLMFSLPRPCELLFLLCFIVSWT